MGKQFNMSIVLFATFLTFAMASRVNITRLGNCIDHPGFVSSEEHIVDVTSVNLNYVDNYCDTFNTTYVIRAVNIDPLEVDIKLFKCEFDDLTKCSTDATEFNQHLGCDKFSNDNTGPWYMISSAMSGGRCGESTGDFQMINGQLKTAYLTKYIPDVNENSRHRLRMVFYKIKPDKTRVLRGCIDADFAIHMD